MLLSLADCASVRLEKIFCGQLREDSHTTPYAPPRASSDGTAIGYSLTGKCTCLWSAENTRATSEQLVDVLLLWIQHMRYDDIEAFNSVQKLTDLHCHTFEVACMYALKCRWLEMSDV